MVNKVLILERNAEGCGKISRSI